MNKISIKPILNKANKQVNFSIPKRKLSKSLRKKLDNKTFFKTKLKIRFYE